MPVIDIDTYLSEPGGYSDAPVLLHKSENIFIFYKPIGWSAHPGGPVDAPDLTGYVSNMIGMSVSPINRLDLDTSGIMILCSKNCSEAYRWFSEKNVEKEYIALVHGRCRRKGTIRVPLSDHRRKKKVEAVTRYRLIKWIGPFSLIRVHPQEGKRHQIRRHLKSIGHPIVGDKRYGRMRKSIGANDIKRMYLHAYSIVLPEMEKIVCPIPDDFIDYLRKIEQQYTPS